MLRRLAHRRPLFKAEPYVDYGGLDYVGGSEYTSTGRSTGSSTPCPPSSWADRESAIDRAFSEYPTHITPRNKRIEEAHAGIPLSYILIARKRVAG